MSIRLAVDRFEVPFDPADPVNTPRDLDEDNPEVLAAFEAAAAALAEDGVAGVLH